VIPSSYWRPLYNKAREVAVGNAETLADRRAKMLVYFQKLGVPEARVLAQLEVKGVEDVTLDHLVLLKGIATAIKEGDTSVDDAFPVQVLQPRRASAAEAPAGVQATSASPSSVPNEGDLGTSASAPASSASPATPPPRETRGLRITHTSFVKPKKGDPYYEVEATAASGEKLKFRTKSEPVYKEAARSRVPITRSRCSGTAPRSAIRSFRYSSAWRSTKRVTVARFSSRRAWS
jgi:hypothetical protein